jgi:mediator of RNA polymerase II transcription subunit 12
MCKGTTISKVLAALDALDRHSFDRMDSANSLDTLYSKVFSAGNNASTLEVRERQENVSQII